MINHITNYKQVSEEAEQYNKIKFVILFTVICIFFTFWVLIVGGIMKSNNISTNLPFGLLGIITPLSIPFGWFLLIGVFSATPVLGILVILVIAFDYLYVDILWAKFKLNNLFLEIIFKIIILIISSIIVEWLMYGSLCSFSMLSGNPIQDNSGADGFQRGDGCWPLESSM